MPTRVVHFRLNEDLIPLAKQAAEADRRSLSNWFSLVVERALEESRAEQEPAQPVP